MAALVRQGVDVHAFNQRTVAEIFDMIRMLGAMVGAADRADRLADELAAGLAGARQRAAHLTRRPRVYFAEWDEPMISGIGWVSELIEAAGGIDVFADRTGGKSAKERIVTAEEIIARAPDIIIGSWCGKKFRPEKVMARPGLPGSRRSERRSSPNQIASDLAARTPPHSPTDCRRSRTPFNSNLTGNWAAISFHHSRGYLRFAQRGYSDRALPERHRGGARFG